MLAGLEEVGTGLLDRLDSLQRVAASAPNGALLFITDMRYPVITNGAPTSNIELVLRRV